MLDKMPYTAVGIYRHTRPAEGTAKESRKTTI